MANFFTRALDVLTPWNRGGETQRRNDRKKREEEERWNRPPTPRTTQPTQTVLQSPTLKKPTNIFEDLNKNLTLGQKKPGTVSVLGSSDTRVTEPPKPGTIVQPTTSKELVKPKQSITNRFRDVFDTNTESDQWRRQEGNKKLKPGETAKPIKLERQGNIISKTPVVGTASKMLNTAGRQIPQVGLTIQQQLATSEDRAAVEEYKKAVRSGDKGKISKAKQRMAGASKRVRDIEATLRAGDEGFRKNDGGLFNVGTLYDEEASRRGDIRTGVKDIALPGAVAALDVYTLGQGSIVSEGVKQGGRRALPTVAPNIVKAATGNFASGAGNTYSEGGNTQEALISGAINSVLGTVPDIALPGVGRAFRNRIVPKLSKFFTKNIDEAAAPTTKRLYGEIQKQIEDAYNAGDDNAVEQLLKNIPEADRPGIDPRGASNMVAVVDPVTKKISMVPAGSSATPRPAPDTPGLIQRILNKFRSDDMLGASDNASVSVGSETASQALRPRPISVSKNIPVDSAVDDSFDVPVQIRTPERPQGPIIREVGGDATQATSDNAIIERAAQLRRDQASAVNNVPVDRRLDGVTPRTPEQPFTLNPETVATGQNKVIDDYAEMLRQLGEGNGVDVLPDGRRVSNNFRPGDTSGKRMSKQAWREEAERQLRAGKAEGEIQKAFNDAADPEVQALLNKGEQPEVPEGSPIAVKQVTGIPITDQTKVPQNLPETPGTVRLTGATDPNQAKSAAVAAQPPPPLPREVQEVLDNPKKFNKRQVAAARNQRKLAMKMAKTQEETADAMRRIETASPAAQSGEGFVPTGEFAKSANGGPIQRVSRAAEMQQALEETSQMSPQDVLQTARTNQSETGGFNRRDIRNIAALFEDKRLVRGTPEWEAARQILKEDGTVWGQQGALRNYTMRRNASTNELISRYESKLYRLADDPTKIDSKWFDEVEAAEDAYVTARDDAMSAYNEFTRNPTSENAKVYHAAQDIADKADMAAKQTEYSVANRALKGNKDVQQIRELDKMANEADMYQMDAVDASMLSGTGTFLRNFVNSAVGGVEEGVFGRVASRIANRITGQNVGGGFGKGSIKGFNEGAANLVDVSKARAANAGKNPLEHIKNWATTGNQLGDTVIDSQVKRNVIDHYTQLLKDQGYNGRELTDRAGVMARQDPDNLAREYAGAARVSAGLGAGVTRNNKIETLVKNLVSDTISAGKPTPATEATGKLVARMTIGFPTAIGRSTVEGVKRFTLGAPTFIKAMKEADPIKRSILVKEGIKQAGTGTMVLPPLFYALGSSGMISGAYPSDDETRAQWEREGKTENSIKIGGAWYQLPAYLGAWAVPGLFYASLGRSEGNFAEATADTAKAIPGLLPTDQASNIMDVINGRTDLGKFMAQSGAAAVRATTPAGALLNQIAKAFDPTKNDTSSGTNIENFVDKVLSGIPGVNNMAGIPDKVSDTGEPISNPNPLEIFAGAASDVQGGGEERSREIEQQTNSQVQGLVDRGIFNDPNLKEILDEKDLAIYNKIVNKKKLKEGELEDLQKALVKGVSATGDDTAYLEREQYDSNLRVLQMKRELMNADKTTKPSDIKKIDTAIKRGEVYKAGEIPYGLISEYQGTGVEEWRKMGDPEDEAYNPEMYQQLFDIDRKMTEAGVSYKKGSLDKPKYTAKSSKGRGGSGGSKQLDTSFGTLKDGTFAPRVREYDSIDGKSGSVPVIRKVRPNIVHKISSSG